MSEEQKTVKTVLSTASDRTALIEDEGSQHLSRHIKFHMRKYQNVYAGMQELLQCELQNQAQAPAAVTMNTPVQN